MGSQRTSKGTKKENAWQIEKPSKFLLIFMMSFQDVTFSARIQDGIPRDNQRDQQGKCSTGRKTQARFYLISWSLFRTSLFPPGSRMGSQGATQGTKKKNAWQVENPSKFLFDFMKSFQDLTFSTRIQDGIPRDNQRGNKGKCLTGRKTLSSFSWILRGPFKTSLFLPLSRMGSQETARGTKKENAWQVEKP